MTSTTNKQICHKAQEGCMQSALVDIEHWNNEFNNPDLEDVSQYAYFSRNMIL
jgi:hypothetical protein